MKYNKEKIKEIILTDYLDGRLDKSQKQELEDIIAHDMELQEFLKIAQMTVKEPFQAAKNIQPPDSLWFEIKDKIQQQNQAQEEPNVFVFLSRLKFFLSKPRLAYAGAGLIVIMFLMFSWFNMLQARTKTAKYNKEKQIEYLMLLASGDMDASEEEQADFGTNIEKYFL